MKTLPAFFAGLMIATTVAVGWVRTHQPEQPSCPQEDSCAVDYSHGAWHVREVTP